MVQICTSAALCLWPWCLAKPRMLKSLFIRLIWRHRRLEYCGFITFNTALWGYPCFEKAVQGVCLCTLLQTRRCIKNSLAISHVLVWPPQRLIIISTLFLIGVLLPKVYGRKGQTLPMLNLQIEVNALALSITSGQRLTFLPPSSSIYIPAVKR
jgi:hypothetical protein